MHVEAIVSGTGGAAHPDPRRPQAIHLVLQKHQKQSRLYPSHCIPGGDSTPSRTQIKKITQDTGHS